MIIKQTPPHDFNETFMTIIKCFGIHILKAKFSNSFPSHKIAINVTNFHEACLNSTMWRKTNTASFDVATLLTFIAFHCKWAERVQFSGVCQAFLGKKSLKQTKSSSLCASADASESEEEVFKWNIYCKLFQYLSHRILVSPPPPFYLAP